MMSCIILDKYISKLPEEAKEKDLFYVRPLEKISSLSKPWYSSVSIRQHSLHTKKLMCSEAGITGHKTNHTVQWEFSREKTFVDR